ncbi:MAG: RidA family protein [Pseudomonadota bacterium]
MTSPRQLISTGSPMEAELAYSRAVVQGDWCIVSGVTGYDYATMTMPQGVAGQASNCFATIAKVLEEAGFAWTDLIRATYYVTDRALVAELAPVLAAHLGNVRPAASMVIAQLIRPDMLVEIEVAAFRG